jgi:flagellar biosynthetic protein FliQ
MNTAEALELLRLSIWTVIIGSGPAVTAAMCVGLIIALLQALTQIQEVTLTFVPKIVAIFLALIIGAPFIGSQLYGLTEQVYGRIEKGFGAAGSASLR